MNHVQTPLIFAYFTGNGEDGLHLAYSHDGFRFMALQQGMSVLEPRVGSQRLMRDPFLMHGPDGLFHALWTTGWQGKDIGYATSSNLLDWSEQKTLPVMAKFAHAQNCWAPEMVFNETERSYLLFWSSTVLGHHGNGHRIFSCSTKDFHNFSDSQLFYDPGYPVIDANIVKNDSEYLMFIKHERGGLIDGKENDTNAPGGEKTLHLATSSSLYGPYNLTGKAIVGEAIGSYEDAAEGPTAVKLGDTWHLYFDYYRKQRYGLMTSSDLLHWYNQSDALSMPKGARHGSICQVSTDILEGLKAL